MLSGSQLPFNRTSMELKRRSNRHPNPIRVAFNRTSMELKRA